ncbi:MAG: LytTR family DNA-binding domain-containing protein [Bacteroidota bacterium]
MLKTHTPDFRPDLAGPMRVLVREDSNYRFIDLNEVSFFEFSGRSLSIWYAGRRLRLSGSYTGLEQRLDARRFFRISKTCIINLSHVTDVDLNPGGRLNMRIKNCDHKLPASAEHSKIFMTELSL